MLKAYILLRTKMGTSKEIVDVLKKDYEENFVQDSSLYGWYDALVELIVPSTTKLDEIVDELKRSSPSLIQVGAAVERLETPTF